MSGVRRSVGDASRDLFLLAFGRAFLVSWGSSDRALPLPTPSRTAHADLTSNRAGPRRHRARRPVLRRIGAGGDRPAWPTSSRPPRTATARRAITTPPTSSSPLAPPRSTIARIPAANAPSCRRADEATWVALFGPAATRPAPPSTAAGRRPSARSSAPRRQAHRSRRASRPPTRRTSPPSTPRTSGTRSAPPPVKRGTGRTLPTQFAPAANTEFGSYPSNTTLRANGNDRRTTTHQVRVCASFGTQVR